MPWISLWEFYANFARFIYEIYKLIQLYNATQNIENKDYL